MIGYFNNRFLDDSEIMIPIKSKVIQYGIGVFEGIRSYWNEKDEQLYIFRAETHFKRLLDSCKIFRLNSLHSANDLVELTIQLLRKNNVRTNTYIRPLFFHGSTKMAPLFEDNDTEFAMYCIPLEKYFDTSDGIHVGISSWQRVSDNAIPARAKPTGLYINSALSRDEAMRNGYDEGIFLTSAGHVSEGCGEHIFMVKNNEVFSPPPIEDNLDGITRRTVIRLLNDKTDYTFIERSIARSELYTCDELFFVGTGAEVTPISSVDNRLVSDGSIGPVTEKIKNLYFETVMGNMEDYKRWLTPVY